MSGTGSEKYDVVVVGAGPAGSTLAALVAMRGQRVLVLEKESFPRYQIGESLLPSTVHGVCRLTGAEEAVARAGFVRKHGGTFIWGASPEPWTFSFALSAKTINPTSFAYQVERTKFDQILLDNARKQGAEVRERCTVTGVLEHAGRVSGVRYFDGVGERVVEAGYVVDASGNTGRLHQSVGGSREYSQFFRNLAMFGYFENGKRLDGNRSGNILCVAFNEGWFWYIPLSATLTSVGAVVRRDFAAKVQGDPDRALAACIAECPTIQEYLADARRVTDGVYGQVRVRKDYSYHQTQFWRPGMVCVGDAACFVDPVFSSGVHLATYGALLAARSINSVIAGIVPEDEAFLEFENRYRREFAVFYEFLTSFYNMHADEQSYFWEARKVTRSDRHEREAFVELVGGLSSDEFDLTGGTAAGARSLETKSADFADAVDQVRNDPDESMMPMFTSSVVQAAMLEGALVETRAQRGESLGVERPRFPGGLVPSADGLLWQRPA